MHAHMPSQRLLESGLLFFIIPLSPQPRIRITPNAVFFNKWGAPSVQDLNVESEPKDHIVSVPATMCCLPFS